MTLKFLKCLHLEKWLLACVIVLLMPYNFCNHNIFISLKIAVIFKVDKVIAPPCILSEKCHFIEHFKTGLNDIGAFKFKNEWKSGIFSTFYFFIIKRGKTLHKPKKIWVCGEDALTRQIAANWFRRFWDGNFDVKAHFVLVGLLWKISMKSSKKIGENRYVSSYDIGVKELNIDQKTVLEYLRGSWIYKEAWCLDVARKLNKPNFHANCCWNETKLRHFWKDW